MQKRYKLDSAGVTVAIAVLTPGVLMMAAGFIGFTSGGKLGVAFAVGLGVLLTLWLGFAQGTYITIDQNKHLYGTLFFFKGHVTSLSDIVSIHTRKTFAGLMTEVYMTYRKKDGSSSDRTIVTKESLKKDDFIQLVRTIRSANPRIQISEELVA